jgi:hypothetical protein
MNGETVGEVARGVVACVVVGGLIFLAATGKPIPDGYVPIAAAVVGYYFGSTLPAAIARLRARN